MRVRLWSALLLPWAAVCVPLTASAEDNPWVPGVSGLLGVVYQSADARATSTPATRDDVDGDSKMFLTSVGLSAELMTPKLELESGGIALFVHGDVNLGFAAGWNTAKEGAAGQIEIAPDSQGNPPPADGVPGTGTTARLEAPVASYAAGLGVSFELPLGVRTLRVRPSLEYRWDEWSYQLRLSDAQAVTGLICPCGTAQLSVKDQKSFHSLGPGIELELDAARAGPVVVSVFLSGRAYHVLGDDENDVSVSGVYSPPVGPPNELSARARFERDPWTYQAGAGIRLRWLPEPESEGL